MKYKRLVPSLLVTGVIVALMTTPTRSEEISTIAVDKSTASGEHSARSTQQPRLVTNSRLIKPITEIRRLSEIERPITSAQMLVQSPTPQATPTSGVVEVTGVKANPTSKGVEIILQTTKGQALQLVNRSSGNSFIAEIPNAQLRLPSGEGFTFRSEKPIAGVSEITVTNFDAKTIRVTVKGEAGTPIVELFDSPNEGLIFSVASTAQRAEQGQPQTQQPQAGKPENQTQPSQPSAQGDEPIELVVTGEQDGYRVPQTSTATKTTDTPIRDIPASIQVIPRQVLEDQRVTRVRDAVSNVSGVIPGPNGSQSNIGESFIFRGFDNGRSGSTFINGFKSYTDIGYNRDLDVANIEQIEILKGPASVLYGQAEPGGILNITTKQPLSTPYYNFEATIGSFDFYRPSFDISGPVNTDKTIRYRLNAAYQNSGSYVDFVDKESVFVAPVLSFDIGKKTSLTLEGEYSNLTTLSYLGIPISGTVVDNPLGKLPRSRFLDEPDLKGFDELIGIGYRLNHKFSDNWSIRNGFRSTFRKNDGGFTFGFGVGADNRTLPRGGGLLKTDSQSYILQTDVLGKIQTGSIKQDLLFGVELGWNNYDLKSFRASAGIPAIDIFDPVYKPIRFDRLRNTASSSQNLVGVYAQDLISIGDQFKILLGGRFDFAAASYENSTGSVSNDQEDTAFSPRVGVVYQPIPPVSLYASWSRSFQPAQPESRNDDNKPFKPTKGEGFEVGVKTELFDGRLAATLAAYQITKQNVTTSDPNNPELSIQVGEQRSRGIEFDLVGRILPGLNLIASYAYTDAEITKDNRGNEGNQPNNVPRHSASLWATYEIQTGGLKGLGFGGGVFFVGDRQVDLENTSTFPSYVRTDAAIFYRRDNWRAALNFKNLFDVYYFEGGDAYGVFPGTPFVVQGTVSVQF